MLMPKRTKYRRVQRGRMKGAASRGNKVSYGEFGIQAMEPGWITGNQIVVVRVAMTCITKHSGQYWKRSSPTSLFPRRLSASVWAPARALRNTGLQSSRIRKSCSKSAAFPKRKRARHCVLLSTSCPSRRRSLPRKPRKPRMVVNKMKANEIRKLSAAELDSKLADL